MYEPELKRRTISEVLGEDPSDYYLPTIQRDFVWDEDDIKQMIESILNGYPIGIITIFKTDIEFPSVPLVDSDFNQKEKKTRLYVLDGQQRLTSLLLIKNGWKIRRNGETIERTPIYFNPDDKSLRVKGRRPIGYDFSDLIKMATFAEHPKPYLQRSLESLRKTFLDRPIAFYIVEVRRDGKSEEEIYKDMSEIFTRINRAGIRLGNLEMFLSFFASASVGKQEIVSMHRELNAKYSMDLEPLIRFVFSNLGLSQNQITKTDSFKRAVEDIKSRYSDPEIREVIENCKKCIETAMVLLHRELGISTTQILPTETALVPVFQYLYTAGVPAPNEVNQHERNRIMKWFILASFNGLYSSQTNTKVESDLKIVKGANPSTSFPLQKLLDSMKDKIKTTQISKKDFTSVDINILRGTAGKKYLFLEYILLCENGATDWTGRLLIERSFNELARHHIFPKDPLRQIIDEDATINHVGNLTFIDRILNEELQDRLPEDYLSSIDEEVLKKHFIPLDDQLWKMDQYEQFIQQRAELMWQVLESLLNNLS
jgi:hypothetical protein